MKHDSLYMNIASLIAEESYCTRRQVGSLVVTPDGVTLMGYNGTVSGAKNVCELPDGTTDPEVLHAEENALGKALKAGISTVGASLFVTLCPCIHCAKLIIQAGITRVVYRDDYRDKSGLRFLMKHKVEVIKYDMG